MSPRTATAALWGAWALSWIAAALWTRRTQARPPFGEVLLYMLPTFVGGALLIVRPDTAPGMPVWTFGKHLWRLPQAAGWATTVVAAAGFAFTWWARVTLGDLWSSAVSRKEGHVIVERGPYGLVRHPIYTGLIAAAVATAVELGSAQALAGAAVMSFGFWMKARLEERFLMSELGEGAYADYRRRTPMLAPFWPMRR